MNQFLKFISYNNAVPIAVSVLFLGAGATFAATDPAALYSADQQVVSVDNTYIVNKDLSVYSPRVQITGVTEDTDNYYVAYTLYTIDLKDSVWQDVTKNQTMTVSKADLGPYRDLGLYVTDQLKQITDHELAYLHNVQDIERKNVTQKVVATTYGGLIGKFLDTSTETLPGYTPVVTPPAPPAVTQTASAASPSDSSVSAGTNASASGANLKIGLQLLGNNPAVIDLRTTYSDLGAVLIDPYGTNVAVRAYQNGKEVTNPTIDTSTSTSYAIEYRAVDPSGATVTVRRIVLVGGAADPGGEITTAGNLSTTPTPNAAPTPAPTPSQTTQTTTQTQTQTQTQQTTPTQTTQTQTSSASSTTTATSSDATTATSTTASSSASSTPATTPVTTGSASSTSATTSAPSDATTTATSTTP